jgi:anthranilate synthase component 1
MYYPSLAEVRKMGKEGNLIPIYCELAADLETPVSAYLKVARGPYSFILESIEGGERLARYSFIGAKPYLVLRGKGNDPLPLIRDKLKRHKLVPIPGLPRFHGGAVGYLSYEVARYFEELPSPEVDPFDLPEYLFMFTDTLIAFDHVTNKMKLISHIHLEEDDVRQGYTKAVERIESLLEQLKQPLPPVGATHELLQEELPLQRQTAPTFPITPKSNMSRPEFEAKVAQAKKDIHEGELIQAVLAQRLSKKTATKPFDIYRALRMLNPSPYMYYLKLDDFDIIGASPELLVRVEDRIVETHPIAGTRPRGRDEADDSALERELISDEKERAEHIMLVDLGRNDIGRVSQPGTVEVTQLMDVERYSHVMHLVSHVQGKLRTELDALDTLKACFPAGTVSGAPKIRAMELIAELEPEKRGPYAGSLGYVSFSGNLDMAITIRTIVLKDGIAHVQAGCGIVADSIPAKEYEESMNKAQALLKAIEQAEAGIYAAAYR